MPRPTVAELMRDNFRQLISYGESRIGVGEWREAVLADVVKKFCAARDRESWLSSGPQGAD